MGDKELTQIYGHRVCLTDEIAAGLLCLLGSSLEVKNSSQVLLNYVSAILSA